MLCNNTKRVAPLRGRATLKSRIIFFFAPLASRCASN